jgi:hypothetical protein
MKNKATNSCLMLVLIAVIVGMASAGFAVFFGLTFGGVAVAVAPDFHFDLVGDFVCPEGTSLEYGKVRYSYHQPGEYTIEASCVNDEGRELKGQELKAIGSVMGFYFLICFTPLLILGIVFSGFIIRYLNKKLKRP